jgi:hypothetical protein
LVASAIDEITLIFFAAPPARMMPFTFEEQQTFDRAQGDLG